MHALHYSVIWIFRVYILCEILNDFWKDIIDYNVCSLRPSQGLSEHLLWSSHLLYTPPPPHRVRIMFSNWGSNWNIDQYNFLTGSYCKKSEEDTAFPLKIILCSLTHIISYKSKYKSFKKINVTSFYRKSVEEKYLVHVPSKDHHLDRTSGSHCGQKRVQWLHKFSPAFSLQRSHTWTHCDQKKVRVNFFSSALPAKIPRLKPQRSDERKYLAFQSLQWSLAQTHRDAVRVRRRKKKF